MTRPPSPAPWWDQRWPWRALAVSAAVGALYPALRPLRSPPPPHWARPLAGGAFVGAWLFFCAFTWRRLARTRDAEDGRVVYDHGVIGWGVPFALLMAAAGAVREAGGASLGTLLSARFAAALLAQAFLTLPIGLWGGYFFGRALGSVFRLPPRR